MVFYILFIECLFATHGVGMALLWHVWSGVSHDFPLLWVLTVAWTSFISSPPHTLSLVFPGDTCCILPHAMSLDINKDVQVESSPIPVPGLPSTSQFQSSTNNHQSADNTETGEGKFLGSAEVSGFLFSCRRETKRT